MFLDKYTIDLLVPKHNRISCSDEDSNGNEYFNEHGVPRCTRCVLLYRLNNNEWPHNAKVESINLDIRLRKKYTGDVINSTTCQHNHVNWEKGMLMSNPPQKYGKCVVCEKVIYKRIGR